MLQAYAYQGNVMGLWPQILHLLSVDILDTVAFSRFHMCQYARLNV